MSVPFTIRVPQEDKDHALRALQFIIDTEGFDGKDARAKALRYIMDQALLGFHRTETPSRIAGGLDNIDCHYLRRVGLDWVCGETMAKKKEPTILGPDTEMVVAGCLDCIRKKEELRAQAIDKLLMKASIVKMREFYIQFMKLAHDGLDVDCLMCRGDLLNGKIIMSIDGTTLQCPLLDDQFVDIKAVCLEKVNPQRGKGCEYFIAVAHNVHLDDMGIIRRQEVPIHFMPTPCNDYEKNCPGVDECTVNIFALAKINKYCPFRYTPSPARSLLPALPEPEEALEK